MLSNRLELLRFLSDFKEINVTEEDFLGPPDPRSADVTLSDILPDDVTASEEDFLDLLSDSPPRTHPLPVQVSDDANTAAAGARASPVPGETSVLSCTIPSTVQELADKLEETEQEGASVVPAHAEGRCACVNLSSRRCNVFYRRHC